MFGYLYETEDGKTFKICKTQEQAMEEANNLACMGYEVTVFDYDIETGEYLKFFTIQQ